MKKLLKHIILLIFCVACKKSNTDELKNDNINKVLVENDFIELEILNSKYDSILRNKLLKKADDFYNKNDFQKFNTINKIVLENSKKNNDSLGILLSNYNIGIYYLNIFDIDSSYFFLTKAEKISNTFKHKKLLDLILLNKSSILWAQKNYTESESLAIKALNVSIKKNDFEQIFLCYIAIANSQVGLNNNSQALDYYGKALTVVKKLNTRIQEKHKALTINYIARIFQKQNQHQKAISIIEEEINEKVLKKLDVKLFCYQKNTKSYSKLKLGDKSVVNKFEETLKIGDSINFAPIQITSKHYLGEYYLQQKDTIQAIKYLIDAQQLAHKNNIFEDELLILKLLAKANITKEAFYNQRYIHLSDSLQDVERISRDKYARIEYETDQVTEEKKIVEKEKKIISNQFIYFATISVLLLSLLGLLLYNKNKRSKLEKKLHQQQQELDDVQIYNLMQSNLQKIEEGKRLEKQRISRDLHDGVIGKLAAIRMNLYEIKHSQSPETLQNHLQHIGQMKKVEEEIRNLTHELNSDVFSDAINFETMIKILFDEIVSNSKTEIKIESDNRINWNLISNQIKMTTYRIFQEAFHNIHKYADASIVKVTLAKNSTGISIQISDNGKGFNIDTTIKKSGIGIKNMKHRIEELNGQFSIDSIKKVGTKINLVIPLQIDTFEI